MPLTLVEKIAASHAVGLPPGAVVRSGDFITIRPRHVMTHDNTGAVIPKFRQIGATRIADPHQPVFAIDHDIQNVTPENLGKYAKIEQFAREQGVDFFPAGTGIAHQIMVEQGYVRPGAMVVGSDSHSNLYGALAALGTPVVRTDAASLWATGVTWWQVPPVARLILRGRLRPGVVGKDVIVALCGAFNHDEVLNHAVEFIDADGGIAAMSVDQRMSIANMTTEWGALAGLFPFDETLRDWLLARAEYFERSRGAGAAASSGAGGPRPGTIRDGSRGGYTRAEVESWWAKRAELGADAGAAYAVELELDLATVVPHVSGPNDVKTMSSLPAIESKRVAINKAWLMSCVNARSEDLSEAARVMKGRKVAPGVEFYLAAASAEVQRKAVENGDWKTLVDAGAIELPPGCGTCIGLGRGTIQAGEVGISATNRNFEGRMGDRKGLVYLGSPAVVAASAVNGFISSPTRFSDEKPRISVKRAAAAARPGGAEVIEGFPPLVKARVLFMDRDNMNTDGIYAGKHTYNDAMTPEEMSKVLFENYDPNFYSVARRGDVIVGGLNFGTGSSREQAATALKHFGIPCVIAASFSETYKRNAFNNGFVVFECPEFVAHLRATLSAKAAAGSSGTAGAGGGAAKPATQIGPDAEIDYRRSEIRAAGRTFPFAALSPVAQELVVAGGAEAVVSRRLAKPS